MRIEISPVGPGVGSSSWLPSLEGAERQKMIRGIILAKEPACRAG
jgi:hypothetical protein